MLVLNNLFDDKHAEYFEMRVREVASLPLEFIRQPFEKKKELSIGNHKHILISGSEESICNDNDWIMSEINLVKEAERNNIPTLGICYGHQLIGRALLGINHVRHAKKGEFGWHRIVKIADDPLFSGIPEDFSVMECHFDEVFDLPSFCTLLARTEDCGVQAMRINEKPIWGLQFHAEIGIDLGKELVIEMNQKHPELDLDTDHIIKNAKDSLIWKRIMENFIKIGV